MKDGDLPQPRGDELWRAIFASSPSGLAVLAESGQLTHSNKRLQQILGHSEADLHSRTCVELTHLGDRAAEQALFEELLAGRRNQYQLNKRFLHQDGSVVWGRQTVARQESGSPRVIVATIEDITAARSTEEKQRGLMYALGERVKELTALHGAAQLLLQTRSGRDDLHAIAALLPPAMQYPEIATACIRYGDEIYTAGDHKQTAWVLAAAFETADGQRGTIEVAYHEARPPDAVGPFFNEEVTLLSSLAEVIRAAIDQQNAARALREINERLSMAFAAAGMGIWEWDVARNTVFWSEHLSDMMGMTGKNRGPFGARSDVVHADDRERVFGRLARAADGQDDLLDLEFRMCRPDGSWRHMKASCKIEREPPARATRIIAVLLDISERRMLERQLRGEPEVR